MPLRLIDKQAFNILSSPCSGRVACQTYRSLTVSFRKPCTVGMRSESISVKFVPKVPIIVLQIASITGFKELGHDSQNLQRRARSFATRCSDMLGAWITSTAFSEITSFPQLRNTGTDVRPPLQFIVSSPQFRMYSTQMWAGFTNESIVSFTE